MEGGGRKHSSGKPEVMERGVALISVLTTAIVVALIIGGLYVLLTRVFEASRVSGIYATTSEAARGGISYAVSQIVGGSYDTLSRGECPNGVLSQVGNCCDMRIRFRILNVDGEYDNNIRICLTGYVPQPGYEITSVADTRLPPGGKGLVYTIISEALGPQGSRARVESLYVR